MSADFTAVDARARGLGAHLFTRAELESLAGHDEAGLMRAVARSPKLAPSGESPGTAELDRAVRLTARRHLRTLSSWEGAAPVLGVFFAEQDRRSLRAMLRGSLGTAPAEERLAGLIPTPTLPERVLAELARQPTPATVVAHLFAVGHPDAARLLPLTAEANPDLFQLELELTRGAAARATSQAARGDENLRRFVRQRIDLANLQSALLLATAKDVDPAPCFVEGGSELPRATFVALCLPLHRNGGEGRGEGLRLKDALAHTSLASLATDVVPDAMRLERAGLCLALATQRSVARLEPLSSAPVLSFLLRLEAQGRDLRRLLWGAALGAPATLVRPDLVTP